jgi:hypothetical protein
VEVHVNGLRRLVVIGLSGLGLALASGSAQADGSPFVGTWNWNRQQSRLPSGEPVPSAMTAEFSRVDALHVRWSLTVTDAQGRRSIEAFDTPANGEFYPISNDTTASVRLNDETLVATFKGPQGETDALTCMLSKDKRRMTCNGVLTDVGGKTENYVDVFDRG